MKWLKDPVGDNHPKD